MKYWNTNLTNMKEYISGEQPSGLDEYIKLNSNENPFPTSDAVLKAINGGLNGMLRRYPDAASSSVRNVFAEQNGLAAENVFVGNGSDEIYSLLFRGFIERDGVASFFYPSYSLYSILAESYGIKYELENLGRDMKLDLGKFRNKNYSMIIISNPNNPTGTFISAESIGDFLQTYRGLFVADEAYIDFYGGSCIDLVNEFDNLIVTRTFSKSYSLAGLRVGLAIANRDIIRGFFKLKDSYNIDSLAIAGATAALLDRKSFNYNISMIKSNKEYLEERLAMLGFETIPSRGNFVLTKPSGVDSKTLYEKLRDRKILVRYFSGPILSEYVRISVGTMMEMKQVCAAIEAISEEE